MNFQDLAIDAAFRRQFDGLTLGGTCAKCGEYIDRHTSKGQGWYAIPCIPIKIGGTKSNNCVIVCPKCFHEIGQDGTKTIPLSALPFYESNFFRMNKRR